MPEQVHPFEPEVIPQRINVAHQLVDAVRRGILWDLRLSGAAVVKEDQRAVTVETTQIAQILDGLARPAGNAHQGCPGAIHPIRELRSVPGPETRHAAEFAMRFGGPSRDVLRRSRQATRRRIACLSRSVRPPHTPCGLGFCSA
jgi:hypothetical protein